jgi:hypothetical protein
LDFISQEFNTETIMEWLSNVNIPIENWYFR